MTTTKSKAPDFQAFWDAYGLKRDRIAAERAWKRLSAKDRKAAMDGMDRYREDCMKRGICRMYAQGYLNHRRWEDEPEQEEQAARTGDTPPAAEPKSVDERGYRTGAGITEEEREAFVLMKDDLLKAWSRHMDAANGASIHRLLDTLELYGIHDGRKIVCFGNKSETFNAEFVVPWFWEPERFDALVSERFTGHGWTIRKD